MDFVSSTLAANAQTGFIIDVIRRADAVAGGGEEEDVGLPSSEGNSVAGSPSRGARGGMLLPSEVSALCGASNVGGAEEGSAGAGGNSIFSTHKSFAALGELVGVRSPAGSVSSNEYYGFDDDDYDGT